MHNPYYLSPESRAILAKRAAEIREFLVEARDSREHIDIDRRDPARPVFEQIALRRRFEDYREERALLNRAFDKASDRRFGDFVHSALAGL